MAPRVGSCLHEGVTERRALRHHCSDLSTHFSLVMLLLNCKHHPLGNIVWQEQWHACCAATQGCVLLSLMSYLRSGGCACRTLHLPHCQSLRVLDVSATRCPRLEDVDLSRCHNLPEAGKPIGNEHLALTR